MIIDTSQGNIEVVGDIKEFKTSIDPKNLEFITTLLSSNLYSDPEQSFIREIVSNAWDSHVEAGTTDIPVIVKFSCNGNYYNVTIRDYGVGLSPKRFQEVYCNIGSSTKRESNEFIGGFGIGKYSSLACSNTVYITSFYEGKAYYYVMVKSGNSITTNLLMEQATQEKNGVEVTIKNIIDIYPYNKALQFITFFPNVYIDGAEDADIINGTKLKRFTNFAAASIIMPSKLLLGNVLYPVQKYHLNYEAREFLGRIEKTGIVIKFNVGEINITPNRENIIYTSDTIKKIEDRIAAAKIELDAMVDAKLTKDYNDLLEYHKIISKTVGYNPITDKIDFYEGYRVDPLKMRKTSITYRGVDLRDDANTIKNIFCMTLPNFKGVISDDKIYTKVGRLPWDVNKNYRIDTPNLLVLNAGARLIASAKLYLRENYNEYGVMTYLSQHEFSERIKEKINLLGIGSSANLDFILEGVYQSMMKNADRLDLDNDAGFLAYKASLAANKSADPKDIRESILYVWNDRGYREKKIYKRFSHAVEFIKGLKKGIILANMDANYYLLSSLASLKNYTCIQARKDIVADLREMKLKCIVDIDWLTKRDPMLSIVKTLVKHFPNEIDLGSVQEVNENLDKDMQDEFLRLCRIDAKFRDNNNYRSLALADHVPYDPYTEHLCLLLKNYLAKHKEAKDLSSTIGCYNTTLTTAVVIKTKAYRVSGEAYNRVRNNKLLNVLCKKSLK